MRGVRAVANQSERPMAPMDDEGGQVARAASPGDALLANVADIVVRFDRELRHLFVNHAVTAVAGAPPEAFIGRTNRELGMPEELCALWDVELGAVFDEGVERRFEFQFDGPNGLRWLEAYVVPERNERGEVETILSVTRDRTEAHAAERELRASEARYRDLFERAGEMIIVFDLEGRLLQVNPAVEQTLGYPRAELIGQTLQSIVAPEERAAADARLARKRDSSETASTFESVLLGKDGRHVPVEASSAIIHHDDAPSTAMMIAHDVTVKLATRAELETSERRFRGAFDGVAAGMVIADPDAVVLQANETFAAMLGYAPAELVGTRIRALVHPDDAEGFSKSIVRLRDGVERRYTVPDRRYLRKDGGIVFANVSVSAIRGEDGSTVALAAQIEDVTAIRQVRAELEESRTLHQAVIDVSPDVLTVIDFDGTVRLVSPSVEGILGYPVDEFVGHSFLEYVHPDDREQAHESVTAAGHEGQPSVVRTRVIAKDGSVRLWDGTVGLWRALDGAPRGVVANLRDVTDQVSLEDQLRQAQKMEAVGRLAGGVAHDFNNLLTAIGGYAELARSRLEGAAGAAEIDGVIDAANKAAKLTAQLLAFSRRQVMSPQTFDLGEVISEMGSLVRRLIPESTELITVLPSAPAPVHADRSQVEQVVMNLVVNAADAMPEGGQGTITLEVVLAADRRETYLLVSDNGVGMDALTVSQIFEPFFNTKGPLGTGLGLSIVHGIVVQSGGHIAVESTPGTGTTFTITLPLSAIPQPTHVPLAPAAELGRETLLLVEDDPGVRGVLVQLLDGLGYRTNVVASGEEAVAFAKDPATLIDLLITDLILPGMNGREAADAFHSYQPDAKVLYMSGYTEDTVIRVGGYDAGIAFIQKPFSSAQLSRRIRELLDQ